MLASVSCGWRPACGTLPDHASGEGGGAAADEAGTPGIGAGREPRGTSCRRRYDAARDAETRTRYQMVLLAGQGCTAAAVAGLVGRSPDTVWRVVQRYQRQGPDGVPHRRRPGHRGRLPAAWGAELRRVIELDPRTLGVPSASWTTGLLAAYLAAGDGAPGAPGDGAPAPAPGGVRLQAPGLDAQAQGRGGPGVGKKRLRVEALLAAAASPLPPPLADLVPDPTLADGGRLRGGRPAPPAGPAARAPTCTCRTRWRWPCTPR